MTRQDTIARAYNLENLPRILSLAIDGEQVAGKTLEKCGGGAILDMAADMAGEIITALEIAEKAKALPSRAEAP